MSDGNSHFLMAVGRHDGGAVVETMDEKLAEVISAVRRTGKKGSVSLSLEVSPNGDTGFKVLAKVKATAPMLAFGESFYFADPDNNLTREAPKGEMVNLFDKGRK